MAASPRLHADLRALTPGYLNDMVVNERGQAYVDCVVWRNLGDPGPE
jgi:hypothetical protein